MLAWFRDLTARERSTMLACFGRDPGPQSREPRSGAGGDREWRRRRRARLGL